MHIIRIEQLLGSVATPAVCWQYEQLIALRLIDTAQLMVLLLTPAGRTSGKRPAGSLGLSCHLLTPFFSDSSRSAALTRLATSLRGVDGTANTVSLRPS